MAQLKEELEQIKNRIGLVGVRLSLSRPEAGNGIEEYITQDWHDIVIRVRNDLKLIPDARTKKYAEKVKITDALKTVAVDLLYHGCGHRELPTETGLGCPHTVENHDRILDGVARALKEKGKADQIVQDAAGNSTGLESYVTNAFEDVLDNVNVTRHTRHAGQILFWNNQGLECPKKKFTPFYEAFVKINLALWGRIEDARLLKRFYSNSIAVGTAVNEFTNYAKEVLQTDNIFKVCKDKDLFNELFNKSRWGELAYRFAAATAPLIQKSQERLCFGIPADGNPFDKLIKLPHIQEGLAYSRYKAGVGPSEHTDPLLQLDALYRKMSRAIPVKTSEYTQASGIPLVHFGRRDPKEGEVINVSKLKGIGFNSEGNLGWKLARYELDHPATYKVHPRDFPKLRVALLDRSSSMALAPDNSEEVGDKRFIPWGDNSKYHYLLKGIYGINNFLERQGITGYVQSETMMFSDTTTPTGVCGLGSEAERRALLKMPSGGTSIDIGVLKSALAGKCFLVSISDGEVENWDSIKEDYKNAVSGADYCHIHIGPTNTFTTDLESWGIPVKSVSGDDSLSRLMIDTTSTYYREGGQ